jgi:RsiW-degrading membrane proteinase PrsW (M82 family)
LAFSALAAVILLGFFAITAMITLLQASLPTTGFTESIDLQIIMFASGLGGIGFLLIPSAVSAGRRLFGNKAPRQFDWRKVARLGVLALPLLLLGFWIQTGPGWSRIFLPLIHVLANSAAVLFLLSFARKGLPDQTASRFWGNLASGLGLTPLIVFTLEFLILIAIGLIWTLLLGAMPEFRQDLIQLASLFQSQTGNPQDLQQALGEFVARPGVLFTLFSYIAIIIPVVEEIFKPAAVWLLSRKSLQPWEGFVLGATSGAGYALFENLTIGAVVEGWTFVALARIGTAAVHIFTSGLVGWGLAWAFQERKYGRVVGAYFGAVILHGIWNGLSILSSVGDFGPVRDWLGPFGAGLADYVPVALMVLALGCVAGIIRANKIFRRAIMAGIN